VFRQPHGELAFVSGGCMLQRQGVGHKEATDLQIFNKAFEECDEMLSFAYVTRNGFL
jgi:hypothetical protein